MENKYKRVPLSSRTVIELTGASGQVQRYEIIDMLEGKGASCLCYRANKIISKYESKVVILKEFYPVQQAGITDKDIIREGKTQRLILNLNNQVLQDYYNKFIDGINLIAYYANREELKPYICADTDVEPLKTEIENGTVYYENYFYETSKYWNEDGINKDITLNEIIKAAIGVNDFLDNFHADELAYFDLKPQDVLITYNENGQEIYQYPKFFDFDSVLKLNEDYNTKDLKGTYGFYPDYFNEKGPDESVRIDIETENHMFGAVLRQQVGERNKLYSDKGEVINNYRTLLEKSIIKDETMKNKMGMKNGEIRKLLESMSEKLDEEERIYHGDLYEKKKKKYISIEIVLLILTLLFYGGVMIAVFNMDENKMFEILGNRYSEFKWIVVVSASVLIAVISMSIKLFNSVMAERVISLETACHYYDEKDSDGNYIRDKNYSGFRKSYTRKGKTYQDNGEMNRTHQKVRLILNTIIGFGIAMSLMWSIYLQSIPVFFALGLAWLSVFMWCDEAFATAREIGRFAAFYYRRFPDEFSITEEEKYKVNVARTVFYYTEYKASGGTIDVNNEFYKKNNRNLYTLRKTILEKCYAPEYVKKVDKFSIKKATDYFAYMKEQEQYRIKDSKFDLKYEPSLIRQIYKMAFDRISNRKYFTSWLISMFAMVVLNMCLFSHTFWARDMFKMPETLSEILTVILAIALVIISVMHILYSAQEERLIAVMSYKSRYIADGALNERIIRDIAAGYIKNVDIGRGYTQYARHAISYVPGESKTTREQRIRRFLKSPINMPLLHYRDITNVERLNLTSFAIGGILSCIFVWQEKMYLLFPVIVAGALVFDYIIQKVVPRSYRKALIKCIEKYLTRK